MDRDFKKIEFNTPNSRKKRQIKKRFMLVLSFFLVVMITTLIWAFSSTSSSISTGFRIPLIQKNPLKSTDDRVNILLLGNAGGRHDGASLTDSIIVASYHLKSKKTTLISIPRDLWLDNISAKINAAYQVGKKEDGDGLKFASDKIDDILGVTIHYAVRLDFKGFSKAVDVVDGVDVEVIKTFDDFNYPIEGKEDDLCGLQEKELEFTDDEARNYKLLPSLINPTPTPSPAADASPAPKQKYKVLVSEGDKVATSSADFACRFEHVHFDQGQTKMDGTTALKFVRSRQGTNGEGSDFARSKRQQLVLQSFKNRVLSVPTLINPAKIAGLITTFGDSFETNIGAEVIPELYNLSKSMGGVDSIVLGDLGQGKSVFVVGSPSKYGAYVLIPPDGDFTSVKEFVRQKLEEDGKTEEQKQQETKH